MHAVDATANGATETIIYSPDTDVFILALRRYLDLCQNTVFVTGKGEPYRTIKLQPIVRALGPLKTAAVRSFHAQTGADNTGSFAKKGKPTCWGVFNEAHDDAIQALSQLGTNDLPSNETLEAVEKLVCQLFLSKRDICSLRTLTWWLFTKKQARSPQLPPTQAALHRVVFRALYPLLVWNNDIVPNPVLPPPEGFGWIWEEDEKACITVMTTLPPAPEAIIHLVKCKCMKKRCANNHSKYRKAELTCRDLCGCSDTSEDCKNTSVVVNNDDCNDEDDDVDDDKSKYEYISDSDGEVDQNLVK